MTNGLDDARALAHVQRIRDVDAEFAREFAAKTGPQWARYNAGVVLEAPAVAFRVFSGIEVDILGEGELDLADATLAEMDIVVASVHSRFDQPVEVMTARVLRAIENPYVRILGHATGRKVLRRDPYSIDLDQVLRRAAELGVAVEHNAAPARAT